MSEGEPMSEDTTTRVDPAALREAHRLAGGDLRRLEFRTDGSVVVRAHPRPGTGPVPAARRRGSDSATVPTLVVSSGDPVTRGCPSPLPGDPMTGDRLPEGWVWSTHALDRCREFSVVPGMVAMILERPDVNRGGSDGRRVLVRDDVPEWCVVVDPVDRVVVTVLRRTGQRWEHE